MVRMHGSLQHGPTLPGSITITGPMGIAAGTGATVYGVLILYIVVGTIRGTTADIMTDSTEVIMVAITEDITEDIMADTTVDTLIGEVLTLPTVNLETGITMNRPAGSNTTMAVRVKPYPALRPG